MFRSSENRINRTCLIKINQDVLINLN
uniref:Uncharacterized protein n=1 Tax=Arundo donax TaxID=35708 RepID=A0A0A9FXJ9_ARUDO